MSEFVLARYAKALAALVGPAVTILISATLAGSAGGEAVTVNEWLTALAASLSTATGVFVTKNEPRDL
ncbi:MAG: hypothetical protein ACRCSN_19700 [Dermatophilaceae bacterium]